MSESAVTTELTMDRETKSERVFGFPGPGRDALVTTLSLKLRRYGWEKVRILESNLFFIEVEFTRPKIRTAEEMKLESQDMIKLWTKLHIGLFLCLAPVFFLPPLILLFGIPAAYLFFRVKRQWDSQAPRTNFKSIFLLLWVVAGVFTFVGAIKFHVYAIEQEEVRKSKEASQHEKLRIKRFERALMVSSELEKTLRTSGVDSSLVLDVQVEPETNYIVIVVTNLWLSRPNYEQKQMKQTIKLLIRRIDSANSNPFRIVDYLGNSI